VFFHKVKELLYGLRLLPYSGVNQAVGQINQQIDDHINHGDPQHNALD
jgi:hypothetical protein